MAYLLVTTQGMIEHVGDFHYDGVCP